MDRYGHLFNNTDFTKQQVNLLETAFFPPVRNPLETDKKRGLEFQAVNF